MFFSNPRSVCNKIDLLNAKLIEDNVEVVILNETLDHIFSSYNFVYVSAIGENLKKFSQSLQIKKYVKPLTFAY